ncbi:MAG: Band 7 protein [Verrucomicrobiales bacterium]|nr:Band 7 protein [Verrucomicrobiales bacterium]
MMDRNFQKIGLVNGLLLLLATIGSVAVTKYASINSGWLASAFLGLSFLVTLISYFQMRLMDREQLEKLEYDELNKEKASATLFTSQEADSFPARRSREQFERFFIPLFTILIVTLSCYFLYRAFNVLKIVRPIEQSRAYIALSVYALFGLVFFILGKYSSGLSRNNPQSLLRPSGSFLMTSAYICFIVTGTIAATRASFPNADTYVARILCVVLLLITVEYLFSLVFEIYRPRVKGRAGRLLYDSRFAGLFGEPESVFKTAAHAMDYQFGFKVSETWFFRFFRKNILILILAQIAILLVSTTVVVIEPGEQALLERFGKQVNQGEVLNPGPHFKLPWPIDSIRRYKTLEVQSFNIGFEADDTKAKETVILWTLSHYKEEYNLLVASRDELGSTNNQDAVPVNLLTVSIPVQFQIKDLKSYAYNFSDAANVLQNLATREVVRYLVGVDLHEIMSFGRSEAAETLKKRIQAEADRYNLGVQIIFIGLQDIHPPVKIAESYENVVSAGQEVQTKLLTAQADGESTLSAAHANADLTAQQARAYSSNKIVEANGMTSQFTNQITAYNASPKVYQARLYYQAIQKGMVGARKIVLGASNSQDVIMFNLEDKFRSDLIDLNLPSGK